MTTVPVAGYLFNLVIDLIAALQTFALPFIIFTNKQDANSIGGPCSALMYSIGSTPVAFQQFRAGLRGGGGLGAVGDHLLSGIDCAPALWTLTSGTGKQRRRERRAEQVNSGGDDNAMPVVFVWPLVRRSMAAFAVLFVVICAICRAANLLADHYLAESGGRSLRRPAGLVATQLVWSNYPQALQQFPYSAVSHEYHHHCCAGRHRHDVQLGVCRVRVLARSIGPAAMPSSI